MTPRPRRILSVIAGSTFVAIVLCAPSAALAQPAAGPTSRLAWDQAAPNVADAIGYIYEAQYDGGAWERIPNVNCGNAASPFTCAGDFPPLTPTTHTVQIRTVNIVNTARLEGPPSEPFTFRFMAVPAAPQNLRITP